MSTLVIGDIHGLSGKLKELVRRINPQSGDEFVFLGDYIDRGDDSFGVIEYLVELEQQFKCTFLKGNHEEMFFDYLSGLSEYDFIANGGNKTLTSYKLNGYPLEQDNPMMRFLPKKHKILFQEMKYLHETTDYIFVHAGIDTEYVNGKYLYSKIQNRDTVAWDRKFHDSVRHVYAGPKTVVYGHTPQDKVRFNDFAICIDTGAVFGGRLTCLVLPERRTVSV